MSDGAPANPPAAEQEMFRIGDAVAARRASSLCQIIGLFDSGYGKLVGTGTFLYYGSRTYILTARHVAKEAKGYPDGCAHTRGTGQTPLRITRDFLFHKSANFDVAVLPLEPGDLDGTPVHPVEQSALARSSEDLEDWFILLGFPGCRSRFSAIAEAIVSTVLPYVTVAGTSNLPRFDPQIHFAIEYPGEGQKSADGREATLPDPHGLSGTAVWKSNRCHQSGAAWTADDAKIIGIVHWWNPDCSSLVATRIESILPFLSDVEADNA